MGQSTGLWASPSWTFIKMGWAGLERVGLKY
ncbi:uncharacterized protein G2W53_032442 [Senna tora]|uniref:Uncharacterized protein n=1 Tax=Senna tora TaxID=362788 RepID=A0A834SXC6_9FABA|nr:uncharacterized protein G2W53_032442 [Senna tora]